MHVFNARSMDRDYLTLLDYVLKEGIRCAPRGMKITEVENFVLVLEDPVEALPRGVGRKHSNRILAAETMQWLAGVSDLAQLNWASKDKFSRFSDDGTRLYGAYGPRAHAGLARAVRLLANDPDSRQAVVSLWNNEELDMTRDLPCTVNWGFRLRDGKLNMSTTMRSWDAWTGLTYDLPAMTRIQSAMAWALGVEIGTYTHTAYSFHVYKSDEEAIADLIFGADSTPALPMLSDGMDRYYTKIAHPTSRWETVTSLATNVVRGVLADYPDGFAWYANILEGSSHYPHFCEKCRYYLPSGELFCYANR